VRWPLCARGDPPNAGRQGAFSFSFFRQKKEMKKKKVIVKPKHFFYDCNTRELKIIMEPKIYLPTSQPVRPTLFSSKPSTSTGTL
jgi:hypothetical protein